MGYNFGAGTTDRINCGTSVAKGNTWSLAVRLKVASANTSTRRICEYSQTSGGFHAQVYAHFITGTNQLAVGHSIGGGFNEISWVTGWTAGSEHTFVATNDGTNLRLYADTDATPKAFPGGWGGTSDQDADQVFTIGNLEGQSNSADGVIYEVAWYPGVVLSGAQAAALGGTGQMASSFPVPPEYWPLVSDAVALYGGHNGTVTGATVVTHTNGSWFPKASAPAFSGPSPRLWLAPDLATADFLDLFTSPDRWPAARRKTWAVKFFAENLTGYAQDPGWSDYVGPNTVSAFTGVDAFRALAAAGVQIAVECPAINEPGWAANAARDSQLLVMANVASAGGHVAYIDVDSALGRGTARAGKTQAQIVAEFKQFADDMLAANPTVQIGNIDSITSFTAAQLLSFVDDLLAAGVPLAWFTVDPIYENGETFWTQAVAFAEGLATRNIPLQMVINPGIASSVTATDADFYTPALANATELATRITTAAVLEVESWYFRGSGGPRDVPGALTETTANSLTKLLLEVATLFDVADPRSVNPYYGVVPLSDVFLSGGGDLLTLGTTLGPVATAASALATYPLLTRLDHLAWRGSWRGSQRGPR